MLKGKQLYIGKHKIWNRVEDIIGKNVDVEVAHDDENITVKIL